jgi:hypothetical protein
VLTFRGAPGWQIESTVGAVVHVFAHADARMEQGAARIGVVPDWARLGLPALALVGVAGVWWLVHRRPSAPVHVVDGVAPVAAVSALLVGATVLSPQYVSWLLPFAAIAAAGGDRLIGWMTALVAGLSTLDLNLVKEVNSGLPLPMAVVVLRNALLLALLAVAVVRIARLARAPEVVPARATAPAHEPALVPVHLS